MGMIRYPDAFPAGSLTMANENEAKPRYSSMTDWAGGVKGDDVSLATATVSLANRDSAEVETDYAPRTQAAKATALGTTIAVDVARARGYVAPNQPYPEGGAAVPAAPVVTSLAPATAAAATLPLQVTITGTGFSVWSKVYTGGMSTPEAKATFVNATTMTVPIWAAAPGTVSVIVTDHGLVSNTDKVFTVT